jgi:hypothetical protein
MPTWPRRDEPKPKPTPAKHAAQLLREVQKMLTESQMRAATACLINDETAEERRDVLQTFAALRDKLAASRNDSRRKP